MTGERASRKAALSMGGEFGRSAVLLDRLPLWLEAVERVLERIEIDVVGKTAKPSVALDMIEQHRPDLFVTGVDVDDPEMDGISCLRTALERFPQLRCRSLDAHGARTDRSCARCGCRRLRHQERAPGRLGVCCPPGVPALHLSRGVAHDAFASVAGSRRRFGSYSPRAGDPAADGRGALECKAREDAVGQVAALSSCPHSSSAPAARLLPGERALSPVKATEMPLSRLSQTTVSDAGLVTAW